MPESEFNRAKLFWDRVHFIELVAMDAVTAGIMMTIFSLLDRAIEEIQRLQPSIWTPHVWGHSFTYSEIAGAGDFGVFAVFVVNNLVNVLRRPP